MQCMGMVGLLFVYLIICLTQLDQVIFIIISYACRYAGFINEGPPLFDRMACEYLLSPSMEHYACLMSITELLQDL